MTVIHKAKIGVFGCCLVVVFGFICWLKSIYSAYVTLHLLDCVWGCICHYFVDYYLWKSVYLVFVLIEHLDIICVRVHLLKVIVCASLKFMCLVLFVHKCVLKPLGDRKQLYPFTRVVGHVILCVLVVD